MRISTSTDGRRIDIELRLERERRVDWFHVIDDLSKAGWTRAHIAGVLGASQSTVQGWKEGSIPNYETGKRLLMLHELVCRSQIVGIPIATDTDEKV